MLFFEIIPFLGLSILIVLIIRQTTSLKRQAIKTANTENKSALQKYLLFPVYFLFFLLLILELLRPLIQFSIIPESFSQIKTASFHLKIAGTLLILLSIVFMKLTLKDFNTSLRFGLNAKNKGKLLKSGVFAVSRNPFFLSIEIYFIGVVLSIPNWFFIVLSVLAIISIHFFILKEEKFMRKNYGDEYLEYAKKVRRYF